MIVLGIETSCDETSVAIVNDKKEILSLQILSQLQEHQSYGGVVPEIAARNHLLYLQQQVKEALNEAKLTMQAINGIAVTSGPGLIGGLIVGVMFAKGMAAASNKPIIAVNHLEAHALTIRLCSDISFPYLLLLVSGGHCQILETIGVGNYNLLGSTLDDAVGEAFDKVAKMLGLGYPGGPIIEKMAKSGNPNAFHFPTPFLVKSQYEFSFSGLKTAVMRCIQDLKNNNKLDHQTISDICASFQNTATKILLNRLENAIKTYTINYQNDKKLVIAGGVAANQFIKNATDQALSKHNFKVFSPPISLCTDNAAMIAWTGVERLRLSLTNNLDFEPKSRWGLNELKNF